MELAGRTLSVDVNRVGKQANGCAFMHYGDTTVLSTATASDKPREGIDFSRSVWSMRKSSMQLGRFPEDLIRERVKHRRMPYLQAA